MRRHTVEYPDTPPLGSGPPVPRDYEGLGCRVTKHPGRSTTLRRRQDLWEDEERNFKGWPAAPAHHSSQRHQYEAKVERSDRPHYHGSHYDVGVRQTRIRPDHTNNHMFSISDRQTRHHEPEYSLDLGQTSRGQGMTLRQSNAGYQRIARTPTPDYNMFRSSLSPQTYQQSTALKDFDAFRTRSSRPDDDESEGDLKSDRPPHRPVRIPRSLQHKYLDTLHKSTVQTLNPLLEEAYEDDCSPLTMGSQGPSKHAGSFQSEGRTCHPNYVRGYDCGSSRCNRLSDGDSRSRRCW